ncbi:phage integrase Arm DNA-binding domain-containing protein [Pantoea agglomerans]|uniref:Phage integrase Arm DNA-binding domain-containing protein n=1 Tax=Enterobacter agglomerans TaxID=549 RepID=A0ACC5PX30_ENTAG|nr:phage integrase Arm DNA-binding domain-containing protein [Pantoea agglomerans]MBD8129178.1 phage integrase Arm DNA-binding domain-containing protein [Pantoea agglomerans]MBD8153767.1 phage integrase Arm DNA-binding domain-containing protein [Pantoea agglomerans]MBD8157786.1 phage integrase Arm DNA-binding domain-containing protein [Pantoea agglomerans]MBD8231624.1 phage integrase Arm DNA-binding domain-containing protein [Pantoea agglomerans]MBD8241682.1 phage integrase Arm DNA-binding dom
MARPRKYNIDVPGLSCYTDARTNKIYWRYKNPATGTFHGLGEDPIKAAQLAVMANERFSEQRIQAMIGSASNNSHVPTGPRTAEWADTYIAIQHKRLAGGELKKKTVELREFGVREFRRLAGNKMLNDINVRDIVEVLEMKTDQGATRMAQIIRATLIDLFKEAQHAGEVQPGFNPALAARNPRSPVGRNRLTLSEWEVIFAAAGKYQPWVQNSLLLAVVTGQRRGDIAKMQFADVWDGLLHIEQEKTGMKIALPLTLRCNALGLTVGEVISRCRDNVLSPYLLHSAYVQKINKGKLSHMFQVCRKRTDLHWKVGQPPSFHEQRSLSERLYEKQGVDTQKLLGHKSRKMTDSYHDDRGREWKVISI